MMMRESTLDGTRKAMRQEKLFLIVPVMTSIDGRWVAMTRWMPTARASWASRPMKNSTSWAPTIISSASSSMMMTM